MIGNYGVAQSILLTALNGIRLVIIVIDVNQFRIWEKQLICLVSDEGTMTNLQIVISRMLRKE